MTDPIPFHREPGVVHQLPPKWDGRDVNWTGWVSITTTAAVHVRRECCQQCGSLVEPVINIGKLRSPDDQTKWASPLAAFRCPDCRNDTVWDRETDEWWTLDESDYGDEGSADPRLF